MQWLKIPTHRKKDLDRTSVDHPTRIQSDLIRNELVSLKMLGPKRASETATASFLESDLELGDLYTKHPVYIQAVAEGFSPEHIVPVSGYFDGAQYTKSENFLGFYITNLRTKKQRLVWLLSGMPAIAGAVWFARAKGSLLLFLVIRFDPGLTDLCQCGCRGGAVSSST